MVSLHRQNVPGSFGILNLCGHCDFCCCAQTTSWDLCFFSFFSREKITTISGCRFNLALSIYIYLFLVTLFNVKRLRGLHNTCFQPLSPPPLPQHLSTPKYGIFSLTILILGPHFTQQNVFHYVTLSHVFIHIFPDFPVSLTDPRLV